MVPVSASLVTPPILLEQRGKCDGSNPRSVLAVIVINAIVASFPFVPYGHPFSILDVKVRSPAGLGVTARVCSLLFGSPGISFQSCNLAVLTLTRVHFTAVSSRF